jgi:nucleoid-associated protein YgaU
MRNLTKEHQAASGRGQHARARLLMSIAGLATAAVLPVQAAAPGDAPDRTVTLAQQRAADAALQGIPASDLAPDAPSQYTVRSGDTLWDIAGRFLRQPWRWPDLWGMNRQQVRNPHLIYPGQVLYLHLRDGRAWLSTTPIGEGGTVRLSPRMRSDGANAAAIPGIPAKDIEPFLARPLVVDQDTLQASARIVALPEAHVYLGRGENAYVRGIAGVEGAPGSDWQVFKPIEPVRDPATGKVLGYQADYQGNARLMRGPEGADAVFTVRITQAQQEMGVGSLLLPQPAREPVRYVPHAPDAEVAGRIAAVYGGVQYGGAKQVVVLNVGAAAGLEPGNVLALSRTGDVVKDRTAGNNMIALPDERYGLAYVFRVFPGVSYALVTNAASVVQVGDSVGSPH